jgi:uncharacterized membrane protein
LRAAFHWLAVASLILLIALCLAWESVLAPLRPGGSALLLKCLPLLAPLFGLLRERLFTYRWTPLLALAYFTEGVVRAWADPGAVRTMAAVEIALSLALFAACLGYVAVRTRLQG